MPTHESRFVTNLKVFGVVVLTLGTFTLVANSIPQVQSEVPEELTFGGDVSTEELVSAGEELYDGAGGCVACHGLGTRAPSLLSGEAGTGPIGERCDQRVQGEDCKTYLHKSMVDPAAYLVEGYEPIMPDMSRTLSDAQIWALVAYLQDQGGQVTVTGDDLGTGGGGGGAGAPGPAAAPAATGPATASSDPMEIMRNNLCLNCHMVGEEGIALGPSMEDIAARLGPEEIRTAILEPGASAPEGYEQLLGTMPTNFGQTLTAGQLEALVRFLASLE